MRCEDYPCCGHAGDPAGCPDFSRKNECGNCRRRFHPDSDNEKYCPRCNAAFEAIHEQDYDGQDYGDCDE